MNIDPPGFTLAEAGVRLIAVMATGGIPLLSLVMNPIAAGAFLALLFIVMALRYGKPPTWSSPDLQVLLPALVASIAAGYLPIRKLDRHTLEVTILMGFALVVFASGTSVAAQEVIGAEHWVEQAGVRPDLNTWFGQVSGRARIFEKFKRAWHYAGAVPGASVRSVEAQPPREAARLP
jgi:hypothetical protein